MMQAPPHAVRFPALFGLENIRIGLCAEVRRVANARGHRMSAFKNDGITTCRKCKAQIEVFRLQPLVVYSPGLGYRGVALEEPCTGELPDNSIIRRVTDRNRVFPRRKRV